MYLIIALIVAVLIIAFLLWENHNLKKENNSCEAHLDILDRELARWKTKCHLSKKRK
jgi:hypothetical protein